MAGVRHIAIAIDLNWSLKHHQATFAGIHRYVQDRGWKCTVWPHPPPRGLEIGKAGARTFYDGVIGRVTPELAELASAAEVPLVNVWMGSPVKDVPLVAPDMHRCGWIAAEHMLARGINKLGYLGFRGDDFSREQLRGFRDAIEIAGAGECRVLNVPVSYSSTAANWDKFHTRLIEWIRGWDPPFGVHTSADMLARYLANAAEEEDLRVPGDVAIVGTVNESVVCRSAEPTLSSVDVGYERVGYRAAELLAGMIGGASPPREPVLLPPAELAARASTDSFAVDDEIVAKALRFMADESHQPIKVSDVVAHVNASHRSLARHFRDSRGRSIVEELGRIRLGRAKRQLVESQAPIKEIAAACGYQTSNRLCEAFRKAEQMTPGEYRRTHALKVGRRSD